jgi:hypothetical protein
VLCLVVVDAAFLGDMEVGLGFGLGSCSGGGVLAEVVFWLRLFLVLVVVLACPKGRGM